MFEEIKWNEALKRMEEYVVKIDVTSSEDSYFMATHMPFENLELSIGGRMGSESFKKSEEEIFQEVIRNKENSHKLIVVRGNNGTGKSHLIRWFKAKYGNEHKVQNSSEKVVFIRRLGNTLKGAIKQLIVEDIVQDESLLEKLQGFIQKTESEDEESFKLTIYHNFIKKVQNDSSSEVYEPNECSDIAQFLSDKRIKELLMKSDGPIERCYNAIVQARGTVFSGEAIFEHNHFIISSSMMREIHSKASQETQMTADILYKNDEEMAKLATYINRFTPSVMQSCADISSEDARDIFIELRRALRKQGQSLTIFIEDFTAFTGIDSELLTALAIEHGGNYSDLCRVESIIGITDAYYESFRDNFINRVTHQITVSESSFGNVDFLASMTARYLNAIMCEKEDIDRWYRNESSLETLPRYTIKPEFDWENIHLPNGEVSLYPFSKRSLMTMFENLSERTPREFILKVIRDQLKNYMDGKIIKNRMNFPSSAISKGIIRLNNDSHNSFIDSSVQLTKEEKLRVKLLLQVWGNGTAEHVSVNGVDYIGSLPKLFLDDLLLKNFEGVRKSEVSVGRTNLVKPLVEVVNKDKPIVDNLAQKRIREQDDKLISIENWYQNQGVLIYSKEFRSLLKNFISYSINWQAEGVPAHIASTVLEDRNFIYIENQNVQTDPDKAVIFIEKTSESKDILIALCKYDFNKSWGYSDGKYFQQKLITWIEKNKARILNAVYPLKQSPLELKALEKCIAAHFLYKCIIGDTPSIDDETITVKDILSSPFKTANTDIKRNNETWNKIVQRLKNNNQKHQYNYDVMRGLIKTYLGIVSEGTGGNINFFKGDLALKAIRNLKSSHWLAIDDVPEMGDSQLLKSSIDSMKELYLLSEKIIEEEKSNINGILIKLTNMLGEVSEENLLVASSSISALLTAFRGNNIYFSPEIANIPNELTSAKISNIMHVYVSLKNSLANNHVGELLALYSQNRIKLLYELVQSLEAVEMKATQEMDIARRNMKSLQGSVDERVIEDARAQLSKIYDLLTQTEG
jgi:hypothetical protein